MKRVISCLLLVLLIVSLSATAFAANPSAENHDVDVTTASVSGDGNAAKYVYTSLDLPAEYQDMVKEDVEKASEMTSDEIRDVIFNKYYYFSPYFLFVTKEGLSVSVEIENVEHFVGLVYFDESGKPTAIDNTVEDGVVTFDAPAMVPIFLAFVKD